MANPIVIQIAMQGETPPVIDSAFTARARDNLLVSTANGPWTLRTPVFPAANDWFRVFDGFDTWGTNRLTIDAGSLAIDPGDGSQLSQIYADVAAELVFILLGGVWRLRVARPLFPVMFSPVRIGAASLGRLLGCPTMTFS